MTDEATPGYKQEGWRENFERFREVGTMKNVEGLMSVLRGSPIDRDDVKEVKTHTDHKGDITMVEIKAPLPKDNFAWREPERGRLKRTYVNAETEGRDYMTGEYSSGGVEFQITLTKGARGGR